MVERPRFHAVLLLCGVLFYPALVSAQAAAVVGNVQDQAGGALPGASVELRPTSGSPFVTQTDAQGAFRFDGVPPGHYVATLTLANFLSVRREIDVAASETSRLDAMLRLSFNAGVVVTATRGERSLADQPESVAVITRQQVEQTPANSLDDVLRTVPSVNLPGTASYQAHPTADSVSMRGLGGIRALVLLDGVPINDPFFGYVQWSRVAMEDVDRIEVVPGGGSPLWGNYAMGGVINIITRAPQAREFGVEGGGGSYGTYRTAGHADFIVNDAVKIRANANVWGSNGFNQVPAGSGPIYVPTSFDARNVGLTAYFKPTGNVHGYLNFNYHDNDQTLISRLSTNNQQIADLAGNIVKNFGRADLTVTAFHEHSHFVTDNTGTPSGVATGFAEFLQNRHTTPVDSTGASVQWSRPINQVVRLISVGADFQQVSGEDSAAIFGERGAQLRTDIGRGRQRFAGEFGQVDIFPTGRLEILASARFQNFRNFDGFDGVGGLGAVPDSSTNSFDPRLSIRATLAPGIALRAAAYTSFRAPTLDNLYRAFSVPFGIFEPSAQLKPEKLKGGEGGFDVTEGTLALHVTAYASEITDLLTYRNLDDAELPAGFFFGTRNINAGKARAQGVEASADWLLAQGWTGTLGYAYMDSHIVDSQFDQASVGKQQAGIPRQQANASLAYADARGWRASTRLRWVDKSWGDNDNTLPVSSQFVVDASFAYKLVRSVEAFVDIENFFDKRYVADNSGFNPPLFGSPRSAIGGLRVNLK